MSIRFEDILGHQTAVDTLRRLLESGRVPQALLFHGPEGVGKATLAAAFTAALLCPSGGCGTCSDCHLLDVGNHLDFGSITPALKSTAKKSSGPPDPADLSRWIRVDQIRQLARIAPQSPRQGRRRVFVIDPADAMNLEAQNALLKTLEEPAPRAVLILLASRPHVLLATIRSRCISLALGPMRVTELSSRLCERGLDPGDAAARSALAGGCPGMALDLDLEELTARREGILDTLAGLTAGRDGIEQLPRFAADLAGKDEPSLREGLDLLEALLRDVARTASGSDPDALVHGDRSERLSVIARKLGAARSADLVASVERLRGDLRFNVNRVLVAESLLAAVAGGPLP